MTRQKHESASTVIKQIDSAQMYINDLLEPYDSTDGFNYSYDFFGCIEYLKGEKGVNDVRLSLLRALKAKKASLDKKLKSL